MKTDRIFPGKSLLFMIVGLVFVSVLTPGFASAQVLFPSDDDVNRVASQLYCPICDNISLDVCPLEACRQWRELIREQLAEGWTEEDIKAYFVAQYGDRVLGEPPRQGLHWMLYVLPPVFILSAFVLLLVKMKRPAREQPLQEGNPQDPYLKQVERDLNNQD
jgi:cytochrome c-type biogenesis protein CcmH